MIIRPRPPGACGPGGVPWLAVEAFPDVAQVIHPERRLASRSEALRIFGQRCSVTLPCAVSPLIRAWEATNRCASSASAISSEKVTARRARLRHSAMLHTRALFPIAGRRAMIIRLPGWKPRYLVEVLEARGRAVSEVPSLESRCKSLSSSWSTSSMRRKSCWRSSLATSRIAFSACSTSRGAGRGQGRCPGSRRKPKKAPEQHVSRRSGVAPGMSRGGDRGVSASTEAWPPTCCNCPLWVSVGDGEHVDRLVLVVEGDHRRVDQSVALVVEVLGFEALLDHEAHRASGRRAGSR